MPQIAVLSDVHGNLPALEAVLADIDARGIDRVFCLGDLAGKGPDGARVVDICLERCEVMVRGNWDEMLDRPNDSTPMDWYRDELGSERRAYLGRLPFTHDFVLSGQNVRLLHASPQDIFHRVHQAGPIEPMLAMFDTTDLTDPGFVPNVVGYGDIHTAYTRSFRGQILFNVGSVGNPLDLTLATYAILEGEPGMSSGAPLGIQMVRVPYDIERALADARRAGLPEYAAYEFELTTGRYRRAMPQPVSPAI
jgi:protein phosphatase